MMKGSRAEQPSASGMTMSRLLISSVSPCTPPRPDRCKNDPVTSSVPLIVRSLTGQTGHHAHRLVVKVGPLAKVDFSVRFSDFL